MQGGFGSTGQRCTASSILVVTDDVHDAFVEAMAARMREWRVGDARATGIDMGPVVDDGQLAQDLRYLDVARAEGADILGGAPVDAGTSGHFLAPALAVGTSIGDTINREEVFGPVMSRRARGRLRRGARGGQRQHHEPVRRASARPTSPRRRTSSGTPRRAW